MRVQYVTFPHMKLFTEKELGFLLKVDRRWVARWRKEGLIQPEHTIYRKDGQAIAYLYDLTKVSPLIQNLKEMRQHNRQYP